MHHQSTYQSSAQRQNLPYQQTPQQRPYSINVQLVPATSQMQLPTMNDQSANMPQMQGHMQTLIAPSQGYQTKVVKPTITSATPYKIVHQASQQSYKFPSPPQSFPPEQFKFNSENFKVLPILNNYKIGIKNFLSLQEKPLGLDLTSPAMHPTKLLPRPSSTEKEEVFAVPKVNSDFSVWEDNENSFYFFQYQMKARSRSRSSSSLSSSKTHPPPLLSAVSDPSLNLNSNAFLAQLLTNSKIWQRRDDKYGITIFFVLRLVDFVHDELWENDACVTYDVARSFFRPRNNAEQRSVRYNRSNAGSAGEA